jgi:hypothetical protein
MNEKVNGASGAPVQAALLRTVINLNPGLKIVYTLSNGMYLGTILLDGASQDALSAMANDLQAFVADQTRGVQVATNLPPGLQQLKPS